MIARCVMVAMAFGCGAHFAFADDWFPMEGSYDEIDACQSATGHCAETEYDVGWEDAVACVDAAYRKDPTLKAQCCEYCDALARCAEGRTTILEYDDDGYYSTRAKNCKESKMCDSDSGFSDVTDLSTDNFYDFSTSTGVSLTDDDNDNSANVVCDTNKLSVTHGFWILDSGLLNLLEVSCFKREMTEIPTFHNTDVEVM